MSRSTAFAVSQWPSVSENLIFHLIYHYNSLQQNRPRFSRFLYFLYVAPGWKGKCSRNTELLEIDCCIYLFNFQLDFYKESP